MKKQAVLALVLLIVFLIPATFALMQDAPGAPTIEITGVNPSNLVAEPPATPKAEILVNVFDSLGQPISGLTLADFALSGELASLGGELISVESLIDEGLNFATVLAIDVSSSMAGAPLDDAKAAARAFIENVDENDPVAIITFGTQARLIQEFTTDKNTLLSAIDNLGYGGRTALYDAGVLSVEVAAQSSLSRRAVILLSDGAEYGGVSRAQREDALRQAIINGVPVYTIGLGYGTDRSYLQELSRGTNAIFTESPTSDQLVGIYTQLADRFRSQYVLSVTAGDLPFDGTEYGFGVQATVGDTQTNIAESTLRMPIPVPLVELDEGQFAEPIAAPHIVNVTVRSDDPVTAVTFSIDGEVVSTSYGYAIDPVAWQPGEHTLEVTVTDVDGDSGSATASFEVAALPTAVTLLLPEGTISEPFTASIAQEAAQTAGLAAVYSLNGEVVGESTSAPDFALTIDPFPLPAGEHTLSVAFTNAGGATSYAEATFTLGQLPPRTTLDLPQDIVITEPTDIVVNAAGQTEIQAISLAIGDEMLTVEGQSSATFTIDPFDFPPGETALSITVTDANGLTDVTEAQVNIGAVAPRVALVWPDDMPEVVENPIQLSLEVAAQTPLASVAATVGDKAVDLPDAAATTFTIDPFVFAPGEQTLSVTVTDSSGSTTTVEETIVIGDVLPIITVEGLVDDQIIREPLDFTVQVSAQSPIEGITINVGDMLMGDTQLGGETTFEQSIFTIDPAVLPPGANVVSIVARDINGGTSQRDIQIIVSSDELSVSLDGIEDGAVLTEPVTVTVVFLSPTPIEEVTATLDGEVQVLEDPYTFTLDPMTLGAGEHSLSVSVLNEGRQQQTVSVSFSVEIEAEVTEAPPTPTEAATEVAALPSEEATEEAVVTAEPTEEATEEAAMTAEPTEEATEEAVVTVEPTEEATEEAAMTAEPTEEATEEAAIIEPTEEATQEPLEPTEAASTAEPSPFPTIVEIEAQGAEESPVGGDIAPLLLIGGGGLLLLILFLLARRGGKRN